MSDRHETGNAVDRRSEVIAVALGAFAGVNRHANAHLADRLRPGVRAQRSLRLDGGIERISRQRERAAESVADGLERNAAMPGHRRAHNRIVLREREAHGVGPAFPELRASFNIREQEGYDPGR